MDPRLGLLHDPTPSEVKLSMQPLTSIGEWGLFDDGA
jgi:hypothetical protein